MDCSSLVNILEGVYICKYELTRNFGRIMTNFSYFLEAVNLIKLRIMIWEIIVTS